MLTFDFVNNAACVTWQLLNRQTMQQSEETSESKSMAMMKADDGADKDGADGISDTPTLQIRSYSSMSVRYRSRPCLARKSLESLLSAAYHHGHSTICPKAQVTSMSINCKYQYSARLHQKMQLTSPA